ncbi:MAG: hypothetical protein WCR56_01160 [Bacilli bacterium]
MKKIKEEKVATKMDYSLLVAPYCSKEQQTCFMAGLKEKAITSLLLNSSKLNKETLLKSYPDLNEDQKDTYLFRFDKEEEQLGKSLLHFGGGFYILDPSSAAISYYLSPLVKKNPLVLDLCAAPGGKSIAFSLRRPDSLIVANDISYQRAVEITKNTDRLGMSNILSLSLDPTRISLPSLFDLVILDAPCSGSGMIRKDPEMEKDWSLEKMNHLLPIQAYLLDKAYECLKKDGLLAYSTCSLSIEEDEEQIKSFIKKHPDMKVEKIPVSKDIVSGVSKLGYHLIPGVYQGEGIYFIFLRKTSGAEVIDEEIKYKVASPIPGMKVFAYRKNEFLVPKMTRELSSLPFIAPGIKIHDDTEHPKCPFDHAYSKVNQNLKTLELTKEEAIAYALGNEVTIHSDMADGLLILTYQGLRLGFGKKVGIRIKNYLPKGLRANLTD